MTTYRFFRWWLLITLGISWDKNISFKTLQIWLIGSLSVQTPADFIDKHTHIFFSVLKLLQSLGSIYYQTPWDNKTKKCNKNQQSRKYWVCFLWEHMITMIITYYSILLQPKMHLTTFEHRGKYCNASRAWLF